MLDVAGLSAGYDRIQVLKGVDLVVRPREWVTIVGANGAGKTTLLWALSGLLPRSGRIVFEGQDITRHQAEAVVRAGIVQVPQGRQLFADLTVEDNLRLGAYTRRARSEREAAVKDMEAVLELFPELADRLSQSAGTLSGGEQQMAAIGRALMAAPRLLMLDEPSTGLAPLVVRRIFEALVRLHGQGMAILLVEQDAQLALEHAERGYVMHTGSIALEGSGPDLATSEEVREIYLGKRPTRGSSHGRVDPEAGRGSGDER
jgi:branched-chain amino acid transport system ATP-binding protein